MNIAEQRFTCLDCRQVFDAELVANSPIDVFVASMKAVRCPQCGGKKIGLGGAHKDAPQVTAPIEARITWWLSRGDTGASSLTIYFVFTAGESPHPATPGDIDDFGRCRALLALIPEWRKNITRVSERYPWWGPFISKWDEFDAAYTELKAKTFESKRAEIDAWEVLSHEIEEACELSASMRHPQ